MSIFNTKRMSALTEKTVEHFVLGAGVFAKNFIPGTDTYESAKTAGKLLGATTGGGEFKAAKVGHYSQVDGAPENTKGLYILDYWTTTMQATVKELTADTIAAAMTAAKKTTEESVTGYDVIVPKSAIELDDYTENVTYIGRLVGSEKPIIIQIFNAFNTNDLSIQPKDNDEASVQVIFAGHYDPSDLETPPYKIYWPKEA